MLSALATLMFLTMFALMTSNDGNAQLSPLPFFPLETDSGAIGSFQCTKNSNEIYAVCGSYSDIPIKYNLQPFSLAAIGPLLNYYTVSCDLYETSSQSTSLVICAQSYPPTILFLQVSDMNQRAQILKPGGYVAVDAPNQVAYSGTGGVPPAISKIINIASSAPSFAGNVTWGQNNGDQGPAALLIVGDFLYAHLDMLPARLARIRISNFSYDKTVQFVGEESYGFYDNLANDKNFIYDLTQNGILVRCTYQNNNFARFDSLSTSFTSTCSLSISPDLKTLFFTARDQNEIVLVNVTAFSRTLATAPNIPAAFGRPIVMSNGIFYAFSQYNDQVFGFSNCYQPTNATYGGSMKLSCPAGYFCPDPDATSPTSCGSGRYTPSEGWCACLLCHEGFLCTSDTTVDPEPCPAGFYCPNSTSSILCPRGSFCPAGSSQPTSCREGTFNTNNGSTANKSCEVCPAGEFCPEGSGSPVSCSCGMYCSVAGRTNCTPGYYNTDPSFFCSLCPEGFFCPSETTCLPIRCDDQELCPPGSSASSQTVVDPLPNSPIDTYSNVVGSMKCTKNSDESYAVCGSNSSIAIKYNLQPFSVAAKGPKDGNIWMSCDLYETSSQSASRAVCAQQFLPFPRQLSAILFLQVSDMTQSASVAVSSAYDVAVDSPNEIAYVSNGDPIPVIFKIINISSSFPIVAANVTWGQDSGDQNPSALLIVGDFLYAHLNLNPARLARISISTFSHDQTAEFFNNEGGGEYDNLANDNNFIYDLTQNGILVRCTYQNSNLSRFDSLSTSFTSTCSLSISPDLKTLFFTAWNQNAVVLVNVKAFLQITATAPIVPSACGRPIIMTNGIFYAFAMYGDRVYGFKYCASLKSTFRGPSKILCPAGHFCPDPNATTATPCSPGTYSSSTGYCFCPACPAGTFCSSQAAVKPQNCPVGTYNPNAGASSIANCLPCPLGKICQEGSITPLDCNQINCDGIQNCTFSSKVLVGVTDAQPYCVVSDHSSCPSPLTCSSINLPSYNSFLQCEAAGCSYAGSSCINRNDCFNLFLPSFVIQPVGLMFIGFAKDIAVLLLIGIFGDVLMRRVKIIILPFLFWKNKWNGDKIKRRMEKTVFTNDANCRDETSMKRESFEEYCERIAIALFELPETDDDELRQDWKRRLIDAITFSMFDSGLWFELDEIEENNNIHAEEIIRQDQEINEPEESETNEHQNEISKQTFSPKNDEAISESRNDEDEEGDKDDSQEVVNDRHQPEEKNQEENQNAESQLQNDQEEVPSENTKCEEKETTIQESQPTRRKLILSPESFATTSTLQQSVNAHITSQAQCVVYFASSRIWNVRAAAAMNSFPSSLQLFYYISSVIIFVAFTFRDVVLDSTNQNIIEQVSNFTCGSAQKRSADKTTYLLLGFRLLNSSSTATVILIFIKTLHAIYSSSSERFKKLQLPQRLPILGLQTSKSTQILLVFYFLVVASFALAGVTYGLHIIPSLVVVVIAALILILDSAVLNLVRHFASKRKTKEVAERDRILQCVSTQELPLLGLNEEEYGGRASMVSESQRSLSTINDDHQIHEEFDIITAVEAFEAAKQSVLNPAPTSLPQALLVFLLREEIPTIIVTITLQLCFNYICLFEFGEAFGVAGQWQLPNIEYEARKFDCIWGMFESDVSSKISVLTSFVGFL